MENHSILQLIEKIELHFGKEIRKYWKTSNTLRSEKLYLLIASSKAKIDKTVLFKKIFRRTYSEKNDYLWRNEIRILKDELEKFLLSIEHLHHVKNNEAYKDWLLIQAFGRIKNLDGIEEKHKDLLNNKDNFASYPFVLDANFIRLNALPFTHSDLSKRLEQYPKLVNTSIELMNDTMAVLASQTNMYVALNNWLSHQMQKENNELKLIESPLSFDVEQNYLSKFYHFMSESIPYANEQQIPNIENAIQNIEHVIPNNKLLEKERTMAQVSLAKELSSRGKWKEAHEVFTLIKENTDIASHFYNGIFYVNYTTNMVKCKLYAEVIDVLNNEFKTDNPLYQNVVLQSRLVSYLYLRDTKNLVKYISFDLDTAPFPQNFMLKIIKSAYFYLIKEYDVALNLMTNLLQAKYISERMRYYEPIAVLYKKLYTLAIKNVLLKEWNNTDKKAMQKVIQEFEKTQSNELKLVSIYLWIKEEVDRIR